MSDIDSDEDGGFAVSGLGSGCGQDKRARHNVLVKYCMVLYCTGSLESRYIDRLPGEEEEGPSQG